MFGEAIDWDRVRIYARGVHAGYSRKHVAVSPLGAVHYRRADCLRRFLDALVATWRG